MTLPPAALASKTVLLQALGEASPRFSLREITSLVQKVSLNKDTSTINLASFMDVMTHADSRMHKKAGAARLSDALSNLQVRW